MKMLLYQEPMKSIINDLVSLSDSTIKIEYYNGTFGFDHYYNTILIPSKYPLDSLDIEIDFIIDNIFKDDYKFNIGDIPMFILHIYHEIGHYKTRLGKVKNVQHCEELKFDCKKFYSVRKEIRYYMFMCHEKLADIWAINFIEDHREEIIGILEKYNWK